jgi:hypothetical protein
MIAKRLHRAVCLAALLLATGVGLLGCSGRSATVSGTVTYQNKKVTSGAVVFVGPDGKASQPALIQEDGTYKAVNVPVGPVKVAVNNPPPANSTGGGRLPANDPEAQESAREAARYVPTPRKYSDADKSGLTTTIKGGVNTYNIELEGPLR